MSAMQSHEDMERAYRVYVTEALRLIPQQKYLSRGFADIIMPRESDDFDADELVRDVISNAGLVVRDGTSEPSREDIRR